MKFLRLFIISIVLQLSFCHLLLSAEFSMQFSQGWNLVSFGFTSDSLTTSLGDASISMYGYSDSSYFKISNPADLATGTAYWAYSPTSQSVVFNGVANDSSSAVSIQLSEGWNLCGNPYQSSISLGNLKTDELPISEANTLISKQLPYYFSGGNYSRITDTVESGVGFWLYVSEDTELTFTPPGSAVCGNSIVETGENCDDGNTAFGDGCSLVCKTEVCGNGFKDYNEECDDGDQDNNDSCSTDCKKLFFNNMQKVNIAAGKQHNCMILAYNTTVCWGKNDRGQLGNGETSDTYTYEPVQVDYLYGATAVALGSLHSCALLDDGTIRCWGANSSGQLGAGHFNDMSNIDDVALSNVAAITSGDNFSCALLEKGSVECWGSNLRNQLGQTDLEMSSSPVAVEGITDAIGISAGGEHVCVLKEDKTVACWGYNYYGQLGAMAGIPSVSTPVSPAGISDVISVAAGSNHTCVVFSNGQSRC